MFCIQHCILAILSKALTIFLLYVTRLKELYCNIISQAVIKLYHSPETGIKQGPGTSLYPVVILNLAPICYTRNVYLNIFDAVVV
jgi:hypothetical protein